jgi:hypothetical protein
LTHVFVAADCEADRKSGCVVDVGQPEPMAEWSLTRRRLKLIKVGARVIRHIPVP